MNNGLSAQLKLLCGLECWYVAAGGAAGSAFSLALGQRVPRRHPLKNPKVSEEFRAFEGEANLLVWCSWRLDGIDDALVSSDCDPAAIEIGLEPLRGSVIASSELLSPAYDLRLTFENMMLTIFCDHVANHPSMDGNWELHLSDEIHAVGPGWKYDVERRVKF